MKSAGDTELASGYSVSRYREMEAAADKSGIAKLIRMRFEERYLDPSLSEAGVRHGFTSMAVGCLMVEALESFRQGWVDTRSRSREAFCYFFDAHNEFSPFRGYVKQFYEDVRCGILHQAQTCGGWKIRRRGPLFDPSVRSINATKFLQCMRDVLDRYYKDLINESWDGILWQKCRKKMDAICKCCEL